MSTKPTPPPSDGSPPAPKHLSSEAKKWWTAVNETYDLAPHELLLLQSAAESWDEMQRARATTAKEGQTFVDRYGCPRPHPAVAIARDAKVTFNRTLRQLNLDVETPSGSVRPPHLNSRQARHFSGNH
jgi:phage terminase small subunit